MPQPIDLSRIGAIYTVGLNYRDPRNPDAPGADRPLIYGKATSSLIADGAAISWDRSLMSRVTGECELGIILADDGSVAAYMIVNDITSQDAYYDSDQWLLGKSGPGFCPVGPALVPASEFDPTNVRLGLTVNGVAVQDGRTSDMRFNIDQILAYLGAHVALRAGDLIATGTPVRIGPDAGRHLQPGDTMTCWIEGLGELTNNVV